MPPTVDASIPAPVIIPNHNSGPASAQCLQFLEQFGGKVCECIVVDDRSTDGSASAAVRTGVRLLSTGRRRGPAYARNLLHCSVHQTGNPQASTFWGGCGAIRRPVFLAHGGFDTRYSLPGIEDVEFGYRLRAAGRQIALDREVKVRHLKHWSLPGLVRTDVFDRGVPWTRLILKSRRMPDDLNLQWPQRISVASCGLAGVLAALAALRPGTAPPALFFSALPIALTTELSHRSPGLLDKAAGFLRYGRAGRL